MEQNHKISVIIPAYNVAEWLPRCLDSILKQTYTNLEILLVDDGSTDDTAQIADEYASQDSRVIVIHQQNAGLIAVREKGIAMATGEYVGFVDGDDMIESDMYARLLANALTYNADISHCGMKYCFYDGRTKLHYGTGELVIYDKETGLKELLSGVKIEPSLCNKLYKKELLCNSCLDLTIVNNEDLLRNFILFSRAERSVFEDFCGYHYWRRADSMSNKKFRAKIYHDILRTRLLILENAIGGIKDEATYSYLNALISSYNATLGIDGEEALNLRKHCVNELTSNKDKIKSLPRGLFLRAVMILSFPAVYRFLYRLHIKRRMRRIKAASKKASQQSEG